VANFQRQIFDGTRDHAQRREIHRVTVAGNDLGRDRLDFQAEFPGHIRFNARIDGRESADGAGNGACRNVLLRRQKALARALERGVMRRQFQAEACRFGVYAVAASDGRRADMLVDLLPENLEQGVNVVQQDRRRVFHLDGQRRIQYVARRHALMDETRVGPDVFGQIGQKGQNVVARFPLDPVDAGQVPFALFPDVFRGLRRNDAETGLSVAGMRLNLEPYAESVFRLPNSRHFGAGITRDHGVSITVPAHREPPPGTGMRPEQRVTSQPRARMHSATTRLGRCMHPSESASVIVTPVSTSRCLSG